MLSKSLSWICSSNLAADCVAESRVAQALSTETASALALAVTLGIFRGVTWKQGRLVITEIDRQIATFIATSAISAAIASKQSLLLAHWCSYSLQRRSFPCPSVANRQWWKTISAGYWDYRWTKTAPSEPMYHFLKCILPAFGIQKNNDSDN